MKLEGIYKLMKALRDQMYSDGKTEVTLDQAEFFALYQAICYMMQIRHIIISLQE